MGVFLAQLVDVVIEGVGEGGGSVRIWAPPQAARALCPGCGGESGRVPSREERKLAEAAGAGRWVEIDLRVRRFFCDVKDGGARRVVEQVAGLTARYGRCTLPRARQGGVEGAGVGWSGRGTAGHGAGVGPGAGARCCG